MKVKKIANSRKKDFDLFRDCRIKSDNDTVVEYDNDREMMRDDDEVLTHDTGLFIIITLRTFALELQPRWPAIRNHRYFQERVELQQRMMHCRPLPKSILCFRKLALPYLE